LSNLLRARTLKEGGKEEGREGGREGGREEGGNEQNIDVAW